MSRLTALQMIVNASLAIITAPALAAGPSNAQPVMGVASVPPPTLPRPANPTAVPPTPAVVPPSPAAAIQRPAVPASAPVAKSTAKASPSRQWIVAIDTGRKPKDGNGQAEFAFNRQLGGALAQALLEQQVTVTRIPAGLTPIQRAHAATGATILVSVNHEVPLPAQRAQFEKVSGYSMAVARHSATDGTLAMRCARQMATSLVSSGRHHVTSKRGLTWADPVLGVRLQDDLAVLNASPVPAVRLQALVLANPAEAHRVKDNAWIHAQAKAIAGALVTCLNAGAATPAVGKPSGDLAAASAQVLAQAPTRDKK